jgi:glutamyl-tRNA synthetase
MIYDAMGWQAPDFAHIPLIHGADGAKLSKRHGALGVDEYRKMGYLPEALRNYLLRLGWAHGDDEIISTQQAIDWFGLENVGKSPSRFDFVKLENLNGHYIREAEDARLVDLVLPLLRHSREGGNLEQRSILLKAMYGLKQRAKTIVELAENAAFYVSTRPIQLDEKAKDVLAKGGREIIQNLLPELENLADFTHDNLQTICKGYAAKTGQKLGNIMSPIRAAIVGKTTSPSMFEVMEILGQQETIERLKDVC